MVTLTEEAVSQLQGIIANQENPSLALRVFVTPGGCSGFSYGMVLDEAEQEGDEIFEQSGIRILVDEISSVYLEGAEIDYVNSLMGGGFTVQNPQAVSTCGCGQSFRTAEDTGAAKSCH